MGNFGVGGHGKGHFRRKGLFSGAAEFGRSGRVFFRGTLSVWRPNVARYSPSSRLAPPIDIREVGPDGFWEHALGEGFGVVSFLVAPLRPHWALCEQWSFFLILLAWLCLCR